MAQDYKIDLLSKMTPNIAERIAKLQRDVPSDEEELQSILNYALSRDCR